MPEGDTILRTAQTLHKALAGKRLVSSESAVATAPVARLENRTVTHVDAHGKDLLIHFDDGSVLHSHMMMTGSWHVYRPGQRWRQPRFLLRVALHTQDCVAVCFNAPVVEWIAPGREKHHPRLTSLGPDILAADFDVDTSVSRLKANGGMELGEAIMHQQSVAGIGNIYKSETLFVCKTNPFAAAASFSDEELTKVLKTARQLMKRNLGPGIRRTRVANGGPTEWVYRRQGQHCLVCDARIAMRRQGEAARSTYYCAECQHVEPGPAER